jgi:hypothetical protein
MFPAHKESPVDPLSKSRHPVMLPVQIMGWVSIFCQSPVIRLCCQCKSWGGFQYFVKVPSSGYVASASHGWVQYFVKVPSSGYVASANRGVGFNILSKSRHPVMLPVQVMGGFNILSKSHHPVMLPEQIMSVLGSIFVKVPSSGYVPLLSEGDCLFLFQRPVFVLLTFLRKDGPVVLLCNVINSLFLVSSALFISCLTVVT